MEIKGDEKNAQHETFLGLKLNKKTGVSMM